MTFIDTLMARAKERDAVRLVDVIPDADVLCALEPEELGLRMLPVLAAASGHPSDDNELWAETVPADRGLLFCEGARAHFHDNMLTEVRNFCCRIRLSRLPQVKSATLR